MYNVLKNINASTMLVEQDNQVYVAKVISLEELPTYKRLIEINNPNVVRLFKTEVVEGRFCVIEEYVQGETLEAYVKRVGLLGDSEVVDIVLQLCNGLSEIHNNGIVHRDINPRNVMLCGDGTIKIIDFGISRIIKPNQGRDTQILGTYGYTAPEQFGFSQTNAKADIYSVGVLANFLKTGRLPHECRATGVLGRVISKCTQIDEAKRYNNINELVSDVSGRGRLKSFISKIPGFRKNIWWHMAIASVYYFYVLMFIFVAIFTLPDYLMSLSILGITFFVFILPVPILTDYNSWTSKSSLLSNSTRPARITLQILLAILSCMLSMIFIIIAPSQ